MAKERAFWVLPEDEYDVKGVMGSSVDEGAWRNIYVEKCHENPQRCQIVGCDETRDLCGCHVFIKGMSALVNGICIACQRHNGSAFDASCPDASRAEWLKTKPTKLLIMLEHEETVVKRKNILRKNPVGGRNGFPSWKYHPTPQIRLLPPKRQTLLLR
jgi:hypothetical protein